MAVDYLVVSAIALDAETNRICFETFRGFLQANPIDTHLIASTVRVLGHALSAKVFGESLYALNTVRLKEIVDLTVFRCINAGTVSEELSLFAAR